jgi:hypothetical protein
LVVLDDVVLFDTLCLLFFNCETFIWFKCRNSKLYAIGKLLSKENLLDLECGGAVTCNECSTEAHCLVSIEVDGEILSV